MPPHIGEAATMGTATCDPAAFNMEMGRFIDRRTQDLFNPAEPFATITMGGPGYSDPVPVTEPDETLVPEGDDRDLVPGIPPTHIDEPTPTHPDTDTPQDIPGAGIDP